MMENAFTILLLVIALAVLVACVLSSLLIPIWIKALASGVPISILRLVGVRLRGHPARLLVDAHILLVKQGEVATLDETEYLFMQNRNRIHYAEDLVRLVKEKARSN
jgi:uncharacterized protein YqfA (UPF0365 family)